MKFPQMGDTYYYICSWGRIISMKYTISVVDQIRISLGNFFRTEEQAEFALEKRKVVVELEQMGINPKFSIVELYEKAEIIGIKRIRKYIFNEEVR